jgi:hypothetical protein
LNTVDKSTAEASLQILYQQALIAGNVGIVDNAVNVLRKFITGENNAPRSDSQQRSGSAASPAASSTSDRTSSASPNPIFSDSGT